MHRTKISLLDKSGSVECAELKMASGLKAREAAMKALGDRRHDC